MAVARHMSGPVKHDAWGSLDIYALDFVISTHTITEFDPRRDPACRHFGGPAETPLHLLGDCPLLGPERTLLLPGSPTMGNCFFGDRRQLQQTVACFRFASRGET